MDINTSLGWTAGTNTTSHDVYFGTNSTPDVSEFQGNQAGTTFDPGTLANSTNYYWRIDEVNNDGTTTGAVWGFTTEAAAVPPGVASNPAPANNATGVNINTSLGWTAGSDTTCRDAYFGTDSTPDASESQGNQAGTAFDPGALANSTIYYWRIDEVNDDGTTTGAVWSFTTEAVPVPPDVASEPAPANNATGVNISTSLGWTADSSTTSHDVYFGTNPTPALQGNQSGASYAPGTLSDSTTYYWRIDELNGALKTTGPTWVFTTGGIPSFVIADLIVIGENVKGPRNRGVATITVQDADGSPVEGVAISGTFSGDWSGTRNGSTDSGGQLVLVTPEVKNGSLWLFCLDTASKPAMEFNESDSAAFLCDVPTPTTTGSIAGIITDLSDDTPIQGVAVSADSGQSDTTDAAGTYTLNAVPTGLRTVTFNATAYDSASPSTTVLDSTTITLDVALTASPVGGGSGTLKGTVTNNSGANLPGVLVQVIGGPSATTNKRGKYTIRNVPEGPQSVTASHPDYTVTDPNPVTILVGATVTLNIKFNP